MGKHLGVGHPWERIQPQWLGVGYFSPLSFLTLSLAREGTSGLWPGAGTIRLEQDVFSALAGQGQIYVHLTDGVWSQIKSAG